MEDAGLVRREFSDDDGRVAHIYATSQGSARAAAARPVLTKLNARLLRNFSEKEIATIARFLQNILEEF
jgi:DNA-binding MarR family transcriptional regulator